MNYPSYKNMPFIVTDKKTNSRFLSCHYVTPVMEYLPGGALTPGKRKRADAPRIVTPHKALDINYFYTL
jgi:hypothetical protein